MKLFFTTTLALVAANAAAAANDDPIHTIGRLAADLVYVAADEVDVDASSRRTDFNANQEARVVDVVSAQQFSERVAVHTDGDGIIMPHSHTFVYHSLPLKRTRIMHLNTCVEFGLRKRAITRVNYFLIVPLLKYGLLAYVK